MKPKLEITPNTGRLIVRRLKYSDYFTPGILIAGQLKAGENLFIGEVLHPGDSDFKKGQVIYYSEYSAATLINVGSVIRGEQSYGNAMQDPLFIVAKEDVMGYEKPELKVDETKEIRETDTKGQSVFAS